MFIQQRGQEITVNAYLQIILLVVCLISVLASLTLFGYSFYLSSIIKEKQAMIDESEATAKSYPFEEMKRLSNRIGSLGLLLGEYASIRSPLMLLEKVVENKVLFTEFEFKREPTSQYSMRLIASTNDYRTLVQQLDALNLGEYTKILPTRKIDNVEEDKASKDGLIKLRILAPLSVQGILPEDILFEDLVKKKATSTQEVTP